MKVAQKISACARGRRAQVALVPPLHARYGGRMISTCARAKPVWTIPVTTMKTEGLLKSSKGRTRIP
eukprot:7900950-Pyramimonas_sp.AAC.1